MKKVAYIVSDVNKAIAFEWIAIAFKNKYDLTFILIGKEKTALSEFLNRESIRYHQMTDSNYHSSLSKWFRLFRLLSSIKPEIVHTHMWRATILGLTTSWLLRVPKRVFTRHHATLHYHTHRSGLKWDKMCNWLATDIIAISKNVNDILVNLDGADPRKVHLIHHGFDLNYFLTVSEAQVELLRKKYSISTGEHWPVIGVIARYVDWKGIQFIIPAFKKIVEKYPKAHLILSNATGDYSQAIKNHLNQLPAGSYTEILFEENLSALYRLFDVYVHTPINARVEAFGQTYIEALACGIPSVFTLSGIAPDFIKHGHNAMVADFQDSESVYNEIKSIIEDKALSLALIENGRQSIYLYQIKNMIDKLNQLYCQDNKRADK